ncbi:MAG: hypothetical protein J5959_03180, partial [Butyrivibrio sp.]|nr:hypothetical protein [Butyrivibrio sp.]
MKRAVKGAFIGLGGVILILAIVYALLGVYYMGAFPCFTWINGIYCTGKSVDEVNDELIRSSDYSGVAILDTSGAKLFVSSADTDFAISYKDSLESIFNNRNPFYWGVYVFKNLTEQYDPAVTLNRDKVADLISDWEIFVDPNDFECNIQKTADGYCLENAFLSVPVKDKVIEKVYDSMLMRESVLDLSNYPECYRQVDLRSGDQEKIALVTKIDA